MNKERLQRELDLLRGASFSRIPTDGQRYIDWAYQLMLRGYESENLFALASLYSHEELSIDRYLALVVNELGLDIKKSPKELFHVYVKDVAKQVVEHKLAADEGLLILNNLWYDTLETDFSNECIEQFTYLSEDITLMDDEYTISYVGLTKENYAKVIQEEMELLLLLDEENLYDIVDLIYCNKCKALRRSEFKKHNIKGRWQCKGCESTDYLAWCDVSDRSQLLGLIKEQMN